MRRQKLVLILIPVVLLVLAVAGRRADPLTAQPVVAGAAVAQAGLMPVAPAADALSTTFYCAGGTANGGTFDSTIIIANPTAQAVSATITAFPGALDGDATGAAAVATLQPVSTVVPVAAGSRVDVRVADIQKSPYGAALVEADHGGVAVERRVSGPGGSSTGPCASSPSASWYVPAGVTTIDARQQLALFNPFPDDAVVDISFATSDGFRGPPPTQGYVIPARHVSVLDVGTVAGRHDQVSTQVLARRGEVVVDALQSFDGSAAGHPKGIAVTLAAPALAPVWMFPEGYITDGLAETYTVFNPNDTAATVDLEVTLDDPSTNGTVDPVVLTVPPFGFAQSALNAEPRLPKGVGHAIVARVRSGPDVAVERTVAGAAPSGRLGLSMTLGSPLVATTWLFPDGRADATSSFVVALYNPSSSTIVRVAISQLSGGAVTPIDGLQDVEVAPGGRVAVDLTPHVTSTTLAVVVTASQPVVAERGLYTTKALGLSATPGIPSYDGIDDPPPPAATTTTTTVPTSVAPIPSS